MKKLLQRTVAILFALCLLIPAAAFTSASPLPPEAGTLTIHKYDINFDYTPGAPADGTEIPAAPNGAVPLGDVEFTIWRVNQPANIVLETAAQARQYTDPTPIATIVTGADGIASISLPKGLYYIKETGSKPNLEQPGGGLSTIARNYVPCAPFLVSMPMRDPSGESWISDIHVYPKNQAIFIDKFVNEPGASDYNFSDLNAAKYKPVSIGQPFGWTIVSSLPQGLRATDSYKVTDVLPGSVLFVPGSVCVYAATSSNTACSKADKLREGTDYTQVFTNSTHTLSVSLTETGLAQLAAGPNHFLIIKYDCTLGEDAPCGVSIPSGASITYATSYGENPATRSAETGNNSTLTTSIVIWEPAVHTGQIGITKLDSLDHNRTLAGAKFGIAATKADALAGNFIATGDTDNNGRLLFSGVAYGKPGDRVDQNTGNTSYWLVEISPPIGYAPLDAPVEILFNHHQDAVSGEYYFAQLSVYNAKPLNTSAPGTGDSTAVFAPAVLLLLSLFAIRFTAQMKSRRADK